MFFGSRILRWPFRLHRRARRSRMFAFLLAVSVLCIFITPFYIIYRPPSVLLRYFQYRWSDVLWRVSTSSKVVALTIDDGRTSLSGWTKSPNMPMKRACNPHVIPSAQNLGLGLAACTYQPCFCLLLRGGADCQTINSFPVYRRNHADPQIQQRDCNIFHHWSPG